MPVTLVKERYPSKVGEVILGAASAQGGTTVSYTHLTLPTNREV